MENNNNDNNRNDDDVATLEEVRRLSIEEVYDEHHRYVKQRARRFVNDYSIDDADDLSQIAWEKIIQEYKSFDHERSCLKTWISSQVFYAIQTHRRAQSADKRKVEQHSISIDVLLDKYS